jgi:hypothetical protein
MLNHRALLPVLLLLLPTSSFAYGATAHDRIAAEAAAAVCGKNKASPLCAELQKYLPFFRHGAVMEDSATQGGREVFNGVEFKDEEANNDYGPCKRYVAAGENTTVCNHYFFIESFLAGGREGACGSSIMGATNPDCSGNSPFQWESARQRGLRLYQERVLFYYYSFEQDKPRAYYWLGRVAHLLSDASVPAHVMPHNIDYVEFEHRSYEHEADKAAAASFSPAGYTGDIYGIHLGGLFVGLARAAVDTHKAVRAQACQGAGAATPGCEKGFAAPTRPLQGGSLYNVKLLNDIINSKQDVLSKPEILKERALARQELETTLPMTTAYVARLLEIFGGQAGLVARQMPAVQQTGAAPEVPQLRSVNFDGVR